MRWQEFARRLSGVPVVRTEELWEKISWENSFCKRLVQRLCKTNELSNRIDVTLGRTSLRSNQCNDCLTIASITLSETHCRHISRPMLRKSKHFISEEKFNSNFCILFERNSTLKSHNYSLLHFFWWQNSVSFPVCLSVYHQIISSSLHYFESTTTNRTKD